MPSHLDPITTWLLKKCVEQLPPIITIVNRSKAGSALLLYLKRVIIIPLLKKSKLDEEDMKNYRPISNLLSISSLLEKTGAR